MKTLTIKDLPCSEELGRTGMAAVRGGFKAGTPSYPSLAMPKTWTPASDSSIHASQSLQQYQQVLNETADGSALLSGIGVHNTTSQFGQNNVIIG
jgi:hypothetical protein